MEVTCNRCNTEYEFEEALVSLRGTTVKCTQCGHLFKVQRASACAQRAQPVARWTIRHTDGAKHVLADLSELPRRIREGSFARDDELSRTGQHWRCLGDIDELDEHFVAADRRGPSRGQAGQLRLAVDAANNADKMENAPEPSRAGDPTMPVSLALPNVDHTQPQRDSVSAVEAYRQAGVRHESRSRAWARLFSSAAIVMAIGVWFFSLPHHGGAPHGTGAPDVTDAMPLDAALQQAKVQPEQARFYAEPASHSQQGSAEAELARDEAVRLGGAVAGAPATLEHMPVSAESLRVSALPMLVPSSELASAVERGHTQLAAGQLTAAKRTFEHALTLQPDSVLAHAGLGQVAIARGRHVQAIDHLVAAALAGDADSLFALADTYRRLGRQHEALAAYQSYLQQNPHGPQLELAKTEIERLTEKLAEQLASTRKP